MKKLNNLSHIFIFLTLLSTFLLNSCGTEEEVGDANYVISLSNNSVMIGSTVTFTTTSSIEGDITSQSVYYVNGEQIEGNVFTATIANDTNEVYSVYSGINSNTATFSTIESIPEAYTQKVLVEDYTGTWCIYCPKMALILDYFTEYDERVVPVAIHCHGPGVEGTSPDPWEFQYWEIMADANNYNAGGQPKGKINRIHEVNQGTSICPTSNTSDYTTQLDPYLNTSAPLGLSLNSSITGNNLNVTIKVGFATDNISDARLVVYLIEEGNTHAQANAYAGSTFNDCAFNQGAYNQHPIADFPQKHVLLKAYTDVFGDVIPEGEISNGAIWTKTVSGTLPANIGYPNGDVTIENLKVVAFVLGNGNQVSNRAVINVQSAHVGEFQDFD